MTSNYPIKSKDSKMFLAVLCLIQRCMGMESVLMIPAGAQVWSDQWYLPGRWCGVGSGVSQVPLLLWQLESVCWSHMLDSVSFSIILEMLNSYCIKSPIKLNSFLLFFFVLISSLEWMSVVLRDPWEGFWMKKQFFTACLGKLECTPRENMILPAFWLAVLHD